MKRIAFAVAAALVAAPSAFAQYDRYDNNRYDNGRYENSYRVEDGHDYRNEPYSARDWRNRSNDYARVLESRPLYAENSARQECWNNRTNRYEDPGNGNRDSHVGAGTAIGAVAGGVIGHQVGSGRGNTAATIGGALLGGLAGHHVENRNNGDDFDTSRCRVTAENGANPVGYEVRYEYNGREYVTNMDHDPGRRLRLGTDVAQDGSPMENARPAWYSGG
jgi:uncharacterized protein YcfJ